MTTSETTPAEVLTIDEAADILRISRNSAYLLARRWRDTDGREGLPVIELGRNLRVPRAGLTRLLEGGRASDDLTP
jgi:transposase